MSDAVDWVHLALDTVQWQAHVNTVLNLSIHIFRGFKVSQR